MNRFICSLFFSFLIHFTANAQAILIPYGSDWKYLDNGTNQGTAWFSPSFSDATWKTGKAELGYGDGDETTIIKYGASSTNKYITTYFRKTINIPDTSVFTGYKIMIKKDDGAVIYINGIEVSRKNMPTGVINYSSLAIEDTPDDGNIAEPRTLTIKQLKKGINVIAVEIHQSSASSSDISFDMELTGIYGTPKLSRGPYLNMGTTTGMIIRWRTTVPTQSKVTYGTSLSALTSSVTDSTLKTEHIIQLKGLSSAKKYYYTVGNLSTKMQGDSSNYFKTSPSTSSTPKVRILAMGDMGTGQTTQKNVRDAYLNYLGKNTTDIWMLLGDNAYSAGLDAEFQTNFFNVYQQTLTKNHVLWPTTGNHDYANSPARQKDHAIAYFDMFSLPKNAEAGGVASGSEAYYSYNYANIHFVALDSYGWETGDSRLYDTTGPQVIWLKKDLAANKQQWRVVYFHHPPYTMGSHNSDTETELVKIRENIVRILERYKVDLVLNGHSHSYERSFLINGHYGLENTFGTANTLSNSSGKYDGSLNSCPYIKNTTDIKNGIVYAVVGSSGKVTGASSGYPHKAMYYSDITNGGALVIEIEKNRLDAKWICADGIIRDNFSMMKNVNKTNSITITSGGAAKLTASWVGNYYWSTGERSQAITVTPISSKQYSVTDGSSCLKDIFNVSVSTNPALQNTYGKDFIIYPTILNRSTPVTLNVTNSQVQKIILYNNSGQVIKTFYKPASVTIETSDLTGGVYHLISFDKKGETYKSHFIVK